MMDRSPPEYLTRMAAFASGADWETLSVAARDRTRLVVADSIAVIAAGMQQPEMQALAARQLAQTGSGPAWVIGTGKRAPALDAALLNGAAGAGLELCEGHLLSKAHPAIQIVPAAIAAAQTMRVSGAELLLAIAIGYDVSARISETADVKLSVHPHGTFGVIGAAVAIGRLKKFSETQMLATINIAATMAMTSSFRTLLDGATVRNIFTGHSGYMGSMAARLAECGFTGEIDGISAVYGKILSETGEFDGMRAVAGLGTRWLIAEGYFKLHPTGRYLHSPIDALEDLLRTVPGGRLDPAEIDRIEIRAYALAVLLGEKKVVSSFGTRFSVPFAIASIIVHGRSGLGSFDDAAVAKPDVQALTQRVDLQEDRAFTARFPAEQPVDMRILLKDGRSYCGRCVITSGELGNPHPPEALRVKFFELGEPVWGAETARKLHDGLLALDEIEDFASFAEAFTL